MPPTQANLSASRLVRAVTELHCRSAIWGESPAAVGTIMASVTGRALLPFEYNLVSRKTARRTFGGDVVPALEGSQALMEYLEFFQTARNGQCVGIVEIEL